MNYNGLGLKNQGKPGSIGGTIPGDADYHVLSLIFELPFVENSVAMVAQKIEAYPPVPPVAGSPLGYDKLLGRRWHAYSIPGENTGPAFGQC